MVFALLITMLWSPVMFGTYIKGNSGFDNKLYWERTTWHGSNEKMQRIKNEHQRKETFDKFTMKRRKTYAVTPVFEMHLDNKNIEPIISVTEILDDGVEKHEIATVREDKDVSVINVIDTKGIEPSNLQHINAWYKTNNKPNNKETPTIQNDMPMLDVMAKQKKLMDKLNLLFNGVKNKEYEESQQENDHAIAMDKRVGNKEIMKDDSIENYNKDNEEDVSEIEDNKDVDEENDSENKIL